MEQLMSWILLLLCCASWVRTQNPDFYEGCGSIKGCLGAPSGCVDSTDCQIAVSFRGLNADEYEFEVTGPVEDQNSYLAFAFSPDDANMEDDNVIACQGETSEVKQYYTVSSIFGNNAEPIDEPLAGISHPSVSVENNVMSCKFNRQSNVTFTYDGEEKSFDINSRKFFVLMATGPSNDGLIQQHTYRAGLEEVDFTKFNSFYENIYGECDDSKGCQGYPQGCLDTFDCEIFMSYTGISKYQYKMEIMGPEGGYVAMAFSQDGKMGNDSVVACSKDGPKMYFNKVHDSTILEDPSLAISGINVTEVDGVMTCTFLHDAIAVIPDPNNEDPPLNLDLNALKWNILMAMGDLDDKGLITRHTEKFNLTSEPIRLPDFNKFLDEDYIPCRKTKGCFGLPSGCVDTLDCDVLVTYEMIEETNDVEFQLIASKIEADSYIAAGLSNDELMGEDSVMACILDSSGENPEVKMSWNTGGSKPNSVFLENTTYGILDPVFEMDDGKFKCTFTRESVTDVEVPGTTGEIVQFDTTNPYYLLVATGSLLPDGNFEKHNKKIASGEKIDFSDVGAVQAAGVSIEIKLHGCFMVFAWFFLGSCGILTARYGKKQFGERKLFKKDMWFPIHQTLMTFTWLLTVTAFILIITKYDFSPLAWAAIEVNPHAVLGLVSFSLMFIQPFMALVRCHPGTKYRPIFNWAHFSVGLAALVFANVAIYFTTVDSFAKINMSSSAEGLVIGQMVFLALWHCGLTLYHWTGERKDDLTVRIAMLTFFAGSFVFSVVMIVLIAIA